MAIYPSSKLEGIMLTLLTLTFHFQAEVLFGIKQQKKSTEFHTDPHNIKLEGYRHLTFTASSHTQLYDVIWIC